MIQRRKRRHTILFSDPCPCGSGQPVQSCHLDPLDNQLRMPRPPLAPPGSETGYAHPKCYLRASNDCSSSISREHYVSKSVLHQIKYNGDAIRIRGAPWVKDNEHRDMTIDSLTANILCERHNSALSPLDAEAGRFFRILTEILVDLNRKTLSRKPHFHLINGDALELWLLKVACGCYHSIGMSEGERVSKVYTINEAKIVAAFLEGKWESRAGLYVLGAHGDAKGADFGMAITPLTDMARMAFVGARVKTNGFEFDLLFDMDGRPSGSWPGWTHRPTELVFERKRREHHLIFSWPIGTPEASLTFTEKNPLG